jgi:hypothetical protein
MMPSKKQISAEQALNLVAEGSALIDYYIVGTLDLSAISKELQHTIIIEKCIIDNLEAVGLEFNCRIQLVHSKFTKCAFNYTYFLNGLTIDHCTFVSYLDFEAGGHNQNSSLFIDQFLELQY